MSVTPPPTGSSQAGLVAGHLLGGRYRLDETLASGGMAQVWRGTDEVLRRAVAIKILHSHLTTDDTFVRRFRQEAIAVAKLSHPAIVSVYDTCSENGVEAIVMELVKGSTLRHRLDAGPMDPGVAANVAAHVAGALDVAHAAGLVHRDIKPANILLSEDGRVKVGDFGIAKAAESSTELTQEGSFIGTAKYLAPEQLEGGEIDGRTDLYSLGVVFYEMVCGRPPFEADGSSATALARLHSDPKPPRQVRPTVPAELETIALRLLARKSDDRYQTASEVVAALVSAGAETGPHTTSDHTSVVRGTAPARPQPAGPRAAATGRPPGGAPPYSTPPSTDHTEVRFVDSERRWLVPTLLVVLTAVSLGIAGWLIGSSSGGLGGDENEDDPSTAAAVEPEPQAIREIADFDPPADGGDGEEHPEDLGNLTDGDPTTHWATTTYFEADIVGGRKPGVGLLVELEDTAEIQAVEIDSLSEDWQVEILVASKPEETRQAWGEPVAAQTVPQGTTTIELPDPVESKYVLVYITHASGQIASLDENGEPITDQNGDVVLEPVTNAGGQPRYKIAITQVQILG